LKKKISEICNYIALINHSLTIKKQTSKFVFAMKKVTSAKGSPSSKKSVKGREEGELKKPTKLKPLKEKEKKGWKNQLVEEDDDDFEIEDDLKIDADFEDGEEDVFYDDEL
jgi:hypothetical protein